MNKREMQQAQGAHEMHECCPEGWRDVPNVSGDYDLDATMMHRANPSLPQRLPLYLKRRGTGYGPGTAYNAYSGYSKDN